MESKEIEVNHDTGKEKRSVSALHRKSVARALLDSVARWNTGQEHLRSCGKSGTSAVLWPNTFHSAFLTAHFSHNLVKYVCKLLGNLATPAMLLLMTSSSVLCSTYYIVGLLRISLSYFTPSPDGGITRSPRHPFGTYYVHAVLAPVIFLHTCLDHNRPNQKAVTLNWCHFWPNKSTSTHNLSLPGLCLFLFPKHCFSSYMNGITYSTYVW